MKKILFLIILIAGCSSQPLSPVKTPSYQRLNELKTSLNSSESSFTTKDRSEEMAKIYLEAQMAREKGQLEKACDLFEEVAEEISFPIHPVAFMHSLTTCDYSASDLQDLWKTASVPSYLKEAYLENSLKLANKHKLEKEIAEFSFLLVGYKQVQSEKVELLKNALAIAEKLKLEEKHALYFNKLVEVSPLFSKEVNEQNIYSVARDFETNRLFEKARALYREIIFTDKYDFALRIKTYNSYRTSYKVERDLKTFLEKTGEMEKWLEALSLSNPGRTDLEEAWIDGKINYARAIWTDHQNKEARKILDDALALKKGKIDQIATIHWIYGSLHVEVKEFEDAIKRYQKALSQKPTDGALLENIQWAIVWNKYLLKKNSEVIGDVDKFTAKSTNSNFTNKLFFWKAKSLLRMNKNEEAQTLLQKIYSEDSFGYYGLIAAMELEQDILPIAPTTISTDPSGFVILDWLIAMDEDLLSSRYLKEIDPQFKTIAEREKAMSLYARTKWYQGGMRQIYSFPMSKRNVYTEKYVSVVFPGPYEDLIKQFASKYNVPEALVFAIIRQESAFNPNVRSWADAFGLMQMIPEKASELSKKYQIPYREFNDLYDPQLNLELGTVLLSELRTLFSSKFAQSVAAYNASTDVIAVWERERFNGNYLEFIEMIPYEETRNYIKLVFRNYITYKRTLNSEVFKVDKKFFELPFN